MKYIGLDEKAFRKGHNYLTIINDLERSRILYAADKREESSLDGFWPTLREQQKDGIEGMALDVWDSYVSSVCNRLADAYKKIVFDKNHIAGHLGEAVDRLRRQERRSPRCPCSTTLVRARPEGISTGGTTGQRTAACSQLSK